MKGTRWLVPVVILATEAMLALALTIACIRVQMTPAQPVVLICGE